MAGWMSGCMGGWVGGWKDRWTFSQESIKRSYVTSKATQLGDMSERWSSG